MTDLFLRDKVLGQLMSRYPSRDGWLIVETASFATEKLFEFMTSKYPGFIRRNDGVRMNNGRYKKYPQQSGVTAEELGSVEYELDDWTGELELMWEGEQIVVVRVPLDFGITSYRCTTFLISKNERLVEDLRTKILFDDLDRTRASAMIQVVGGPDIPKPTTDWNQLFLAPGMAETIRNSIDSFFKARDRYRELGVAYRRGLLFLGPPGNGKTQTIRAIASNFNVPMVSVQITSRLEERDISHALSLAEDVSPSILVFEDLDKIFKSSAVCLSYILNALDGLRTPNGIILLATSNDAERIDPALLHRPSRFDRVFYFTLPDYGQRLKLLQLKGGRYFARELLEDCAKQINGFSMAYTQEVVVNALLYAINQQRDPEPRDLIQSMITLKEQNRSVSKTLNNNGSGEIGFDKAMQPA